MFPVTAPCRLKPATAREDSHSQISAAFVLFVKVCPRLVLSCFDLTHIAVGFFLCLLRLVFSYPRLCISERKKGNEAKVASKLSAEVFLSSCDMYHYIAEP